MRTLMMSDAVALALVLALPLLTSAPAQSQEIPKLDVDPVGGMGEHVGA